MAYSDLTLWTMLLAGHSVVGELARQASWRERPQAQEAALHDFLFYVYRGIPGSRPDLPDGGVSPAEATTPVRLQSMLEHLHLHDPPGGRKSA